MKYKVFMFLLFFLLVFIVDHVYANSYFPLQGKLIVIDVGHGGIDPGTSSGDILEKDINLDISLILESELTKKGASVILTRDGDYDLSSPNAIWRKKSDFDNRIMLINESKADLYLSIHLNYLTDSKYSGGQIFYSEKNEANKKIAEAIQLAFNDVLESNRVVKNVPDGLYMYDKLQIPGVLVECGFLSNYQEKIKLTTVEYQKLIAEVITTGVINYF